MRSDVHPVGVILEVVEVLEVMVEDVAGPVVAAEVEIEVGLLLVELLLVLIVPPTELPDPPAHTKPVCPSSQLPLALKLDQTHTLIAPKFALTKLDSGTVIVCNVRVSPVRQ